MHLGAFEPRLSARFNLDAEEDPTRRKGYATTLPRVVVLVGGCVNFGDPFFTKYSAGRNLPLCVVPSMHVPVPDLCQNACAKVHAQGLKSPERIAWSRPYQYSVALNLIVTIIEEPGP
jgi:hypothetical protein